MLHNFTSASKLDHAAHTRHCALQMTQLAARSPVQDCITVMQAFAAAPAAGCAVNPACCSKTSCVHAAHRCWCVQMTQLEARNTALVSHMHAMEDCCIKLIGELKSAKETWCETCVDNVKLYKKIFELRKALNPGMQHTKIRLSCL